MIKKWKSWLDNNFGGPKHKKRKYMLIIAMVGIVFILISNLFSGGEKSSPEPPDADAVNEEEPILEVSLNESVEDLEKQYESELVSMLNQIKGISETEVMINVDSTNEQVYEKNRTKASQTTDETDKSGGKRDVKDETEETELVYIRQGEEEVPVVVQTKKPAVRGVFVIAKGAEKAEMKKWIVDAVSRVLDVPAHKISVMPK